MESIVTTAIIGTGHPGSAELATGTPIDTLTAQLGESEIERKLLLTAGALSVYRQAGIMPQQAPEAPLPTTAETIPACSSPVGHLVQSLLEGTQRELLPEALERLKRAGLRLPYEVLPVALGYGAQSREIRPALFSVIGERGLWLSQFEKTWAWVTQFLAETAETLPANAETLWQEGTLGQRCQLLARIRMSEPAKASQWLADVWKKEKAETRAQLLATFKNGLSLQDEPLLENALDDRSEAVRTTSASLLARLPTSALAQRMLARADTMLAYANGELIVTEPTAIDVTWQRDGITAPARTSQDNSLLYIKRVLPLIPPTHWEERFSTTPKVLIEPLIERTLAREAQMRLTTSKSYLIAADDEVRRGKLLLGCWSYAAACFGDATWAEPLWAWWCKNPQNDMIHDAHAETIYTQLVALLPLGVAERYVEEQFVGDNWQKALRALPMPWSAEFGDACLETLRHSMLTLDGKSYPSEDWQQTLTKIALALPPTCFANAQLLWEFPDNDNWHIQQWKRPIKDFTALIYQRQRIIKEI